MGELFTFNSAYPDEDCACGKAIRTCPFWTAVINQVAEERGLSPGSVPWDVSLRGGSMRRRDDGAGLTVADGLLWASAGRFDEVLARCSGTFAQTLQSARNNLAFIDAARQVSGRRLVADSSKNPMRLKALYLARPEGFRFVHLVRDGRAVARSWTKAYPQFGGRFVRAALQWQLRDRLIAHMAARIPRHQRFFMRYEDLCRDPSSTLAELCRFLEISFDPGMVRFREAERHDVHINPRPLEGAAPTIRLDETWRTDVGAHDLSMFRWLAGRWNRRYGYTW